MKLARPSILLIAKLIMDLEQDSFANNAAQLLKLKQIMHFSWFIICLQVLTRYKKVIFPNSRSKIYHSFQIATQMPLSWR